MVQEYLTEKVVIEDILKKLGKRPVLGLRGKVLARINETHSLVYEEYFFSLRGEKDDTDYY